MLRIVVLWVVVAEFGKQKVIYSMESITSQKWCGRIEYGQKPCAESNSLDSFPSVRWLWWRRWRWWWRRLGNPYACAILPHAAKFELSMRHKYIYTLSMHTCIHTPTLTRQHISNNITMRYLFGDRKLILLPISFRNVSGKTCAHNVMPLVYLFICVCP